MSIGGSSYFHKLFLRGRVESGNWFKFVKECHAAAAAKSKATPEIDFISSDQVFLCQYEHMLRHPQEAVAKVARFLDIEVTPQTVAEIAEATSFNSMAKKEKQQGVRLPGWPHRKLPGWFHGWVDVMRGGLLLGFRALRCCGFPAW